MASEKTAPGRSWSVFARFALSGGSRFLDGNHALKLKRPKVSDPPTRPYMRDEIAVLLAAGDEYTDWQGYLEENAHRLHMFVLPSTLSRWTCSWNTSR
jgi:hypothetical protein